MQWLQAMQLVYMNKQAREKPSIYGKVLMGRLFMEAGHKFK